MWPYIRLIPLPLNKCCGDSLIPQPSSLPPSCVHASYHYHTFRECLVIYSEVCLVDVAIGFFWMVITAAFFPLQSITLRYDGCLLAKHKHLRFRLAKRRVILLKSKLPFILSEIVAPLVCQPKAASTWTLSRCYDA